MAQKKQRQANKSRQAKPAKAESKRGKGQPKPEDRTSGRAAEKHVKKDDLREP